jgi:hypothetical protein
MNSFMKSRSISSIPRNPDIMFAIGVHPPTSMIPGAKRWYKGDLIVAPLLNRTGNHLHSHSDLNSINYSALYSDFFVGKVGVLGCLEAGISGNWDAALSTWGKTFCKRPLVRWSCTPPLLLSRIDPAVAGCCILAASAGVALLFMGNSCCFNCGGSWMQNISSYLLPSLLLILPT